MVIVLQSTKPGLWLRRFSKGLALALAILVPCSAATVPDATAPKLTTLYSFPGTPGGGFLEAGLVRNSTTSVLYGTTADGGAHGWGTVYQLVPGSGGTWTQTVLYSFNPIGLPSDGASPQAGLIIGTGGVLYGTTTFGGSSDDGTVFSLTPPTGTGPWIEKVLHSFTGADGSQPEAGLALAPSTGGLYGTTYAGGTSGFGTVFQLSPPSAGGNWTEKVIYNFTGGPDGGNPVAGLALSTSQIIYGTTYTGGTSGYGTVFQLAPAGGGAWTQSVLYSFTNGADGSGPEGGVIIHNAKVGTVQSTVLYGTAFWAGNSGCPLGGFLAGCGTAFALTSPATTGAPWTFAVLHTFTGTGTDGAHPSQNLSLSSTSGALYGTTFSGGSATNACFGVSYPGCGTIFVLRPPTQGGVWVESILHDFNGKDGGGPNGVVPGVSGIYYGTTYIGGTAGGYGSVFQLTPQ